MSSNTITEDFLENDNPIPGQNFVCLSFVSPEKILKKKEIYYVREFLRSFFKSKNEEIQNYKKMNNAIQTFYELAKTNFSDNDQFSDILNDLQKYSKISKASYESVNNLTTISYDKINSYFNDFVYKNETMIEKQFSKENDFQTTMRGLKIRGVYDTQREAEVRAKVLHRKDKNFSVFVGQVGFWLPWQPASDKIKNQEYAENELNTLVKKYKENQQQKEEHFEENKLNAIKKAEEENKKKKLKILELKRQQAARQADSSVVSVPDEVESVNKIKELRGILNEKDAKYNALMNNDDPWTQKNRESETNETNVSDVSDVAINVSDELNYSTNEVDSDTSTTVVEADSPVSVDSNHSDNSTVIDSDSPTHETNVDNIV